MIEAIIACGKPQFENDGYNLLKVALAMKDIAGFSPPGEEHKGKIWHEVKGGLAKNASQDPSIAVIHHCFPSHGP